MKIKKNLLKFSLGALAVALPTVALTSCGSNTVYKPTFAEIVVSDDTSVLEDQSFSESTYIGWKKFMEAEIVENKNATPNKYAKETIDMPEVGSGDISLKLGQGYWRRPTDNRGNTYNQIFNSGKNLILAPGFNHAEDVSKVALKNQDKGFILLDSAPATADKEGNAIGNNFPNVASFTFRAEQSGFLSGIATAEFLNANKDLFTKGKGDDGELKVGGFVGQPFPSTLDFLSGFQHGIIAYNLSVDKQTNIENANKKQKVKWIGLGDTIDQYSSNSFGPGGGNTKSRDILIKNKADAIIPIAGPQTNDAVNIILTDLERPAIVIGVDSAQENDSKVNKPLQDKHMNGKKFKDANGKEINESKTIHFSAIKKLDEAVSQTLTAIFNKENPNNENGQTEDGKNPVKGFGFNNIGTLENKTVGVSDNGLQWVKLFNENWVNQEENSKLVFNTSGGIYDDPSYKNLQDKRELYTSIDNITNGTNNNGSLNLNDSTAVISKVDGEKKETNLFEGLSSNNPEATSNKTNGTKSLDGSSWSLELQKIDGSVPPADTASYSRKYSI